MLTIFFKDQDQDTCHTFKIRLKDVCALKNRFHKLCYFCTTKDRMIDLQ